MKTLLMDGESFDEYDQRNRIVNSKLFPLLKKKKIIIISIHSSLIKAQEIKF